MGILLATLGGTWQVVPELCGFTNPDDVPLYARSPDARSLDALRERLRIAPVAQLWLVSTADGAEQCGGHLERWAAALAAPLAVRLWWPAGMRDLCSGDDARRMAELIFRLLWHAHGDGPAHLGLAGGRKTMSADLQRAGELLGWASLLHVIDRFTDREQARRFAGLEPPAMARPLDGEFAAAVLPVVLAGPRPQSDLVLAEREAFAAAAGPLPSPGAVDIEDTPLLDRVEQAQARAAGLAANYVLQISGEHRGGAFRGLYALPARWIERLRDERIGERSETADAERKWLRKLPKADLHCHLGGLLDAQGMVRVARCEAERVAEARRGHAGFDRDLEAVERMAARDDLDGLRQWLGRDDRGCWPDLRGLRERWSGVPEPLGTCGFLAAFAGREALLEALVWGELLDPGQFRGIGIERYEALGDLQGSGLLQSRATLREAVRVAAERARADGVRYLELRCSPANCTRGGLDDRAVVDVLLDALDEVCSNALDIRLLFIASRHGRDSCARRQVDLVVDRLGADARFAHRFVGFDLAGAEHAARPAQFRELFAPLHERVVRITIHAGEGEDVGNVWEAVYALNADRVGHGLTLWHREELLARFRDREIAIELCPSSNYQIVGADKGGPFADALLGTDGKPYPLQRYLDEGLRVTVNTDDPGISRTTLSAEYHKAAAMSEGGLTRWQVLQLVRNGFRAAFCSYADRERHLRAAERAVIDRITEEYGHELG